MCRCVHMYVYYKYAVYHLHFWFLWRLDENVGGPRTGVREVSMLYLDPLQEL